MKKERHIARLDGYQFGMYGGRFDHKVAEAKFYREIEAIAVEVFHRMVKVHEGTLRNLIYEIGAEVVRGDNPYPSYWDAQMHHDWFKEFIDSFGVKVPPRDKAFEAILDRIDLSDWDTHTTVRGALKGIAAAAVLTYTQIEAEVVAAGPCSNPECSLYEGHSPWTKCGDNIPAMRRP